MSRTADVVVVGSGVCGLLVARELLTRGRQVTLLERGGLRPWAEQRVGDYQADVATAAHNHESHPDTPPHPWDYVYGVGGTTLKWTGVAVRMLPGDFELRSRYGVGRDWPIGVRELAPFYDEAEGALAVAAGSNELVGPRGPKALPPHPYAPVDNLVRPMLEPYRPLGQARPTRPVGGRPACCASAHCWLCPVDSRYSGLHTFAGVRAHPNLNMLDRTVVARLRTGARRVTELECIGADGERSAIRARTVVLAANGIENAAILLRSSLPQRGTGRWLYDHIHRVGYFRTEKRANHGVGTALATGMSYAYADGDFRSERASVLVYPYNPGVSSWTDVVGGVMRGDRGAAMRERLRERFDHTLVLDSVCDDLPLPGRFVELSPNKDEFGLPKNRIRYPDDSGYAKDGVTFAMRDIERRLRPIGARLERIEGGVRGGHQIGTCRMGPDGVVDENLRHHDLDNLYVAGASAFPAYGAAHPTLTVAALALRLGRHIGAA